MLLAVLFLMLLGLPLLYMQTERIEQQRARDKEIKKMLTQPAPPQASAPL